MRTNNRKPVIIAPLDRTDEIRDLITCGANELYCGVFDRAWVDRYPIAALNRRVEMAANLKSFEELQFCVDRAHSSNVSIALTLNEHYYTQAQYPFLLNYVERATRTGVDALIVSDPALMLVLREEGFDMPLHVSVGGAVLNARAARFYQQIGASRVVLERQLAISEMVGIISALTDMETAVFILNSRCANIDGLCTFDHTPFRCNDPAKLLGEEKAGSAAPGAFSKDVMATGCCMLPYEVELHESSYRREERFPYGEKTVAAAIDRQRLWERHHIDTVPCGACALPDLYESGVTAVKIVGRGNPVKRKIGDIGFIKMLLALIADGIPREEFRKHCRYLRETAYSLRCGSVNCYYPEVLTSGKEL